MLFDIRVSSEIVPSASSNAKNMFDMLQKMLLDNTNNAILIGVPLRFDFLLCQKLNKKQMVNIK